MLNEADIIGASIANLFAQGVAHIYIALSNQSDDGTRAILEAHERVTVIPDALTFHDQPRWTQELSELAAKNGAAWVVPFDADEFVYVPDSTIASFLAAIPAGYNKVYMRRWLHKDINNRHVEAERLPKVAWRANLPIVCQPGNHDVTIAGSATSGLELRELQFRSFEHMARKCRERVRLIDPTFGWETGTHQRILAGMSDENLRVAWDDMQRIPTVYDPIPGVRV